MQCPDGPTSPSQSNRPIGLRPVVLATCDLCVHLDLACAIPPADRLYRTYSSELQLFGQHDAWPRPGHECCELRSFFCLLCLALQSKRLDRLVPWSLEGLRVLGCGGLGKAMPRAVRLGVDHEAFRDADRIVNVHLSVFARHGPGIVRGCFRRSAAQVETNTATETTRRVGRTVRALSFFRATASWRTKMAVGILTHRLLYFGSSEAPSNKGQENVQEAGSGAHTRRNG